MKNIKNPVLIEEDMKIDGKIFSLKSVLIEGAITGEIITGEKLIISREGKIRGNAKTVDTIINGKFIGNLIASGTVDISPTGFFEGNLIIKASDFYIENGGIFKGKVYNAENEEIFNINKDETLSKLKIDVKKIA
jgi:cytoskeletal protein CcmA (bactofilin family)